METFATEVPDTQAACIVRDALHVSSGGLDAAVLAHARRCLLDYLSCAFEALPLPWSTQAGALAEEQIARNIKRLVKLKLARLAASSTPEPF